MAENGSIELGHPMLQYFKLAPDYTNLNHGSFGVALQSSIQKQREYNDIMEAKPDVWCRRLYIPIIDEVRVHLSSPSFLNCDVEGLVMVENSSTGVNSVLRSIKWEEGDTILYLSTAYPMVINTSQFLLHSQKVNVLKVELHFPCSSSTILERVKEEIEKYKKEGGKERRIKMAIISHITSVPAFILPVQELVSLFRHNNILSLIDGAHALGQIPVDISAINPDFYTGNLHKWCYTPKGTAFLYVSPPLRSLIVPLVISSEYFEDASFSFKFQYTGTKDYTPFCAVGESLKFINKIGMKRIMDYLHKLAVDGGKLLSSSWNTEVLHSDESMVAGMVNVRVPTSDLSIIAPLTNLMLDKHNTYIVFFPFQGGVWTRLSAAIYLEIKDIQWMANIVLDGIRELEASK